MVGVKGEIPSHAWVFSLGKVDFWSKGGLVGDADFKMMKKGKPSLECSGMSNGD